MATDARLSVLAATSAACAGVGIRGLWRGYLAGLCVWGPFSASYFGFFETVKQARTPLPAEMRGQSSASPGPVQADHPASWPGGSSAAAECARPSRSQALPGEGTITTTAASVFAGAVAAILTQPLDCAKTRLQVGACEPGSTFLQVLRRTYAHEGIAALMRGSVARALWLAPGCGLSMTVFEFFSKALGGSCA